MFEKAREYLQRILPWDGQEFVGLHYTKKVEGRDRPIWLSRPVKTVEDAIRQLAYITKQPDIRDIYVALATQKDTGIKTTKDGKQFPIAIRSRENSTRLKCLYLDIDVKEGAGYETQKDAIAALKKFITDAQLPPITTLVYSGSGGMHVYWTLEQPISVEEWQLLADALVSAAEKHELKCDTQVTVDAVRILRIPDTLNHKHKPAKPVELKICREDIPNEVMVTALQPYIGLPRNRGTAGGSDDEDELGAGLDAPQAAPRDIEVLRKVCPWIEQSLTDGGTENNNALRKDIYLLSTFVEDGDDVAWRMVRNRSTLDEDEFDETLERTKIEKAEKRMGFPRCQTIRKHGSKQCINCPKYLENKSPLSVTGAYNNLLMSTNVRQWYVPDGYRLDANDYFWEDVINKDGQTDPVMLLPNPVKNPWFSPINGEWFLQFQTVVGGNQINPVVMKAEETATKDSLGRALRRGLIFAQVDERVYTFMTSFLKKLQSAKEGIVDKEPFGWDVENGFTFFGKHYTDKKEENAPFPDGALLKQYKPTGKLAPWVGAARLITQQGRPSLDVLIATSFAAPLIHLLGDIDGVVVGGISMESGVGKSTTLRVAASVWGHPLDSQCGLSDTVNSAFGKAGRIRHLPLFWDEIKTAAQTANFVSMIFQLTGGREKARMTRSATLRDQKTWSTILTYTSNESLYDAVLKETATTTAGHMRMFEFKVDPITEDTSNKAVSPAVAMLRDNFGIVGQEYAAYLGAHKDDLKQVLSETRALWNEKVEATDDERFWTAACTTLLVGARLANELDFTTFDLEALEDFLFQTHKMLQDRKHGAANDLSNPDNVAAILGDFLAAKAFEHTVVTNIIWTWAGRPHAGAITLEGDGTSRYARLRSVEVHWGRDNKVLRMSESALSLWLKSRGIGRTSFFNVLTQQFRATFKANKLGAGTQFADSATRPSIEIHFEGTGLEKYLIADDDVTDGGKVN